MERKVTVLKPAGREEQIERWGLPTDHVGQRFGRRERFLLDATPDDDEEDERELQAHQFLVDGGWTAIEATRGSQGWTPGARDAGMTSHRGVLHPDEHVNTDALRGAVEAEFGFTYENVHAVYRRGRLSASTLELRARIDARLLELASAGANVAQLGRVLGFSVNASGSCEALNNALARARKEHA